MNKFWLASLSMVASSVAFFAGHSYAADAAAPTAQAQEANAPQNNEPKYLGKTGIVLAPGPVRLGKDGKPLHTTKEKAVKADKADAEQNNEPKYLGQTGIVLAPGPVRLGKDGKPLHTVHHTTAEERHQQNLRTKANIEALNAGKAPSNNEQRALARMTPHDRELVLKRTNEALALYKGK